MVLALYVSVFFFKSSGCIRDWAHLYVNIDEQTDISKWMKLSINLCEEHTYIHKCSYAPMGVSDVVALALETILGIIVSWPSSSDIVSNGGLFEASFVFTETLYNNFQLCGINCCLDLDILNYSELAWKLPTEESERAAI